MIVSGTVTGRPGTWRPLLLGRGSATLRGSAAVLLASGILAGHAVAQSNERATFRDRVVRLESQLALEVPDVTRWEEELGIVGRRISVGDAGLYVEDQGTGIPLVLLHGGPGATHHAFHPWFGRASGFARVIYYDQRGSGLSDWEPGDSGYSVDQAVRDLEALRVALDIDDWVVAGFSYGGFLAQYYATIHPEHVAGLVLIGAGPGMWSDFGPSHANDYIAPEERERMIQVSSQLRGLRDEQRWSYQDYTQLLVYNRFLNGDWKRQHFYQLSRQEVARIARYDWVQDERFRGPMNYGQSLVDLTGAFDQSPIPTLILEGKWDFTWGDSKATVLSRNHPNARMMVVENAGHNIYDENPDAFFAAIEDFLVRLPRVTSTDRARFRESLAAWRAGQSASLDHRVLPWDWGITASRDLVAAYRDDMLGEVRRSLTFTRMGFAFYDVGRYEDAIVVFAALEQAAAARGDQEDVSFGILWQGHLLDLLGRREQAVERYERVVARGYDGRPTHDQYGLRYSLLEAATQRLTTPFAHVENREP